MKFQSIQLICCLVVSFLAVEAKIDQPNFLFILADDLGYNDVGFRNGDVLTPNLDSLARGGQILEHHYVQPLCTPSRAAFLTGMYPYHIGRQGFVIQGFQPTGLTLERKLLPEYLKELGYSTHLVGKWHLGFCKDDYQPNNRGFDSYFGFWNGGEDYFTKMAAFNGFDFHEGNKTLLDDEYIATEYSTFLFRDRAMDIISQESTQPFFLYLAFQTPHVPLNVPEEYEDMYPHIMNPLYKKYYAMITAMDESIGAIVQKLKDVGKYDNTIIVFMGDNGAPIQMHNSNNPLRGFKGTIYEGGTRTAALIHSPLLPSSGVNENIIHISDWMPTFMTLAGAEELPDDIDGVNQAEVLFGDSNKSLSGRQDMVYNIQNANFGLTSGAIRSGNWKLIVNPNPILPMGQYHLYDLDTDPLETTDLKDERPDVLEIMLEKYDVYLSTMVPEDNPDTVDEGPIVDGAYVSGWC